MSDDEWIRVPEEQFTRHLLPLLLEGEIEWHVSDEVKEQISYQELADPSNVENVQVDEDRVEIHSELSKTVSELVRRATYNPPDAAHPAEYKNHKVPVWVAAVMEWPEDDHEFPDGSVVVEQVEDPTASPPPDVDAYRYDL